MKTLRLFNPGDFRFSDEPIPTPRQDEQLVNVKAVGVCGSDLHWFSEGGIGNARLDHPLILGHEFAGITQNGLRVAVDPAIPCRECEHCVGGNPNLCEKVIFAGHGAFDGALREWIAWDEINLFPIPDTMTYAEAAMLEPLGVAIHSLDLAHLKVGMHIGVFGCGPIGLLIIQLARLAGAASITASDILAHRLDAAKELGANHTFFAQDRSEVDHITATTQHRGLDVVFEAAGEQDALDTAFLVVNPGGKVMLVGIPANDKTSFSASTARRKGLTIKLVRRMKNTYPRAINMVANGLVDVHSLITQCYTLEQASLAFKSADRREGLKTMIEL